MMEKENIRELLVLIFLLLLIFVPVAILFFAEGGQLYGVNYDPATMKNPYETSSLVMVPIEEEITPIYDGTEIIQLELWELPPREIFIRLITYYMAYIPPTISKLIGFFYVILGLAFIILYRKCDIQKNLLPESRPEKILAYITSSPGKSMQQISSATEIPRGTLRHYLLRMIDKSEIVAESYSGNPYYYPAGIYSQEERVIIAILSHEKEYKFFQLLLKNPDSTIYQLAKHLNIKSVSVRWYLKRFKNCNLLVETEIERKKYYRLTHDAAEIYIQLSGRTELMFGDFVCS